MRARQLVRQTRRRVRGRLGGGLRMVWVDSPRWRRGSVRLGTYWRILEAIRGLVPWWMTQAEYDDGEVVDLEGGMCWQVAW